MNLYGKSFFVLLGLSTLLLVAACTRKIIETDIIQYPAQIIPFHPERQRITPLNIKFGLTLEEVRDHTGQATSIAPLITYKLKKQLQKLDRFNLYQGVPTGDKKVKTGHQKSPAKLKKTNDAVQKTVPNDGNKNEGDKNKTKVKPKKTKQKREHKKKQSAAINLKDFDFSLQGDIKSIDDNSINFSYNLVNAKSGQIFFAGAQKISYQKVGQEPKPIKKTGPGQKKSLTETAPDTKSEIKTPEQKDGENPQTNKKRERKKPGKRRKGKINRLQEEMKAVKSDIRNLSNELKTDLVKVGLELKNVKEWMTKKMAQVEQKLTSEIAKQRKAKKVRFTISDSDIDKIANTITSALPNRNKFKQGKVLKRQGNSLVINLGSQDQLTQGLNLLVVSPQEVVVDIKDGKTVRNKVYLAEIYVTNVSKQNADCIIYKGSDVKAGDLVLVK